MSDQNKDRSRRFFEEGFGEGNLELVEEFWGEDAVSLPMNVVSSEQIKQSIVMFRNAFPDLTVKVIQQIAEDNTVASRVVCRGTHEGLLMGQHEATGKPVEWTMLAMHHHENGKIVEGYGLIDLPGIMRQIGT